jgi:hypothetical protein
VHSNGEAALKSILFSILLLCCAAPQSTFAQDIVVRDENGRSCVDIVPGGDGQELYVVGLYNDLDGFPGVEFRIEGLPPEWIVSVVPGPEATFVLGDPFVGGTNIAFPVCYPGSNNEVLLFTVLVAPTSMDLVTLDLGPHSTPSNPSFNCPLLNFCPPVDGVVCLQSGTRAVINGGELCPVGVEQSGWAGVKQLYR